MLFHQRYPVYICIANYLCEKLAKGAYRPNERFLSVRDCANQTGVNPNTVAKSFDLLTEKGIITNRRGIGFFVTEDAVEKIMELEKAHFLQEEIPAFMEKAKMLNIKLTDYIK